jgi:DNA-binding NarL/FixJ family response regulator
MSQKRIRVVIADDHEALRKTWKLLLEQDERIEIIAECSDGSEAVTASKTLTPDVILMDINMKPMNGFEATKKITAETPTVKIIGMSINNQSAYVRKMFESGAKGYITKSSSKEEMIKAILEVYSGKTYVCDEMKNIQ